MVRCGQAAAVVSLAVFAGPRLEGQAAVKRVSTGSCKGARTPYCGRPALASAFHRARMRPLARFDTFPTILIGNWAESLSVSRLRPAASVLVMRSPRNRSIL